jgi:menaquinone-dependent protoporphyrinogen oxidase
MRVLVVYGSRTGGTRGIARTVAAALVQSGHQAEARAACEVQQIDDFDAVVVGGALYANSWPQEARHFVWHHADQLRAMPVFFFSSGPLDDSALQTAIPPTRSVQRLMDLVSARAHVTFGGRLRRDARGFIAEKLVRAGKAGDFRDIVHIDSWTRWVASMLDTLPAPVATPLRWRKRHRARHAAATLTFFAGTTATLGGLELMWWREGAAWLPDSGVLSGTPFATFLVPGLLLFGLVGLVNLVAALLMLRRHPHEQHVLTVAGALTTGYIVSEMALLQMVHGLQLVYLLIGVCTAALGLWLALEPARRRQAPRRVTERARTT